MLGDIAGFTRQEVIRMTGAKPGNLSYLDRTGLVVPYKEGNPKRPASVIYTVEQVLQIKIIERLRERISLQEIRKVLEYLSEHGYKPSLFKCNIFAIGSQVYLIEDNCELGLQVREASDKNKGQIVIHDIGSIGDVIEELKKQGQEGVLNFSKRAEGTLLAAIV